MRSPATAIAWDLYRRYRWGFWAVLAYLVSVSVIGPVEYIGATTDRMAWTLMVPLGLSYYFLLAVFSLGFAGDVAARGSMYPARVFTLPVSNSALAGWPMLFGAVTVIVLWQVTAWLLPWPKSAYIPKLWPAFFLAAILAWMQVLLWLPYPLKGLRIAAAVVWLTLFSLVGNLAIHFQPAEAPMVALFAPQLPLAFLVARYAVRRARCGDSPDWRGVFNLPGRTGSRGRPRHYSTAFQAQVAYEWGQYGWSLPLWVAILLPFALGLLFLVERPEFVLLLLLVALLLPPVMAAFVAASVQQTHASLVTRPMTSAALVGAKLTAAAASTLVTWLLVFIAVSAALVLSDTLAPVTAMAGWVSEAFGTVRGVVLPGLVLAGLMTATWKLLVQGLYIGLSGRAWMVRLYISLALAALIAVVPLYFWIRENVTFNELMYNSATPWRWGLGLLVGLKVSLASWAMLRLQRANLLDGRALLRIAVYWTVAVFALYGVFIWLLTWSQVPGDILLAIAILAIPLTRLMVAPVALDWNRHRW